LLAKHKNACFSASFKFVKNIHLPTFVTYVTNQLNCATKDGGTPANAENSNHNVG
jgi:hypothetical protein